VPDDDQLPEGPTGDQSADAADGWRRWVPPAARPFVPDDHADAPSDEPAGWRRFVPAQWRRWLDASPAPRPQSRTLRFVVIDEERPGRRWQALFGETWPAYRAWWTAGGHAERPDRMAARAALEQHMPELLPVYEDLVSLAGDDDDAASMLALWNPPPFIVGCSQAVLPDRDTGRPVLIRNYDYDPRLFEATVYRSRWSARRVLGTGDCLWGLVDGVNDDGLAASLTFGGRQAVGEGFGVPLVMRYVLETCADVAAAADVLRRLPHQLSYNITLCDRTGAVATVFVAPDRPARVTDETCTTNHPGAVEWPEHAAWVRSVERLAFLRELQAAGADASELASAMLEPPLLARQWDEGFATLFTAAYRPVEGTLTYHWPGLRQRLALTESLPESFTVDLTDDADPAEAG
jgi:predicted choloylglycine hydrolase